MRLAGPVVAAEVGWTSMWLVDTIIVGRLGAEAIGAVSIGGTIFFGVAIVGFGILLGLDFVVATAVGAGRRADADRALVDGVALAIGLGVLLTAGLEIVVRCLPATGIQPAVLVGGIPYLRATAWSMMPLLVFTAFRRYLQACGAVRPIMLASLSANVVNAAACWVLVFGTGPLPGFGVALINDSKYGHATHGNVMRLSLLRSPYQPSSSTNSSTPSFWAVCAMPSSLRSLKLK